MGLGKVHEERSTGSSPRVVVDVGGVNEKFGLVVEKFGNLRGEKGSNVRANRRGGNTIKKGKISMQSQGNRWRVQATTIVGTITPQRRVVERWFFSELFEMILHGAARSRPPLPPFSLSGPGS